MTDEEMFVIIIFSWDKILAKIWSEKHHYGL